MPRFTRLLPRYADSPDLSGSDGAANDAMSTGRTAINSFDPKQTAGAQQANTNNLFNTQQDQTQNYVDKYTKAVASNPSVTSLYNTANDMFNVPQLAQNATNLTNRVNNLVPSGYAGARGFDIDSTDINNGIAQSSAYLTPQANAATANYNSASGLASNYVQAGQTQNAQNLLPVQAEQANLLQEQAAQATGWNNAAQSEFQGLIDKMNAGVTLSGQEMQRANQLAALEESYQEATKTANIGNQYKVLSPSQTLANTMTGAYKKF